MDDVTRELELRVGETLLVLLEELELVVVVVVEHDVEDVIVV